VTGNAEIGHRMRLEKSGSNSVFVSKSSIDLPGCNRISIVTAAIERGRPHRVLMVQAMLLFEGLIPPITGTPVIDARPSVNGTDIEPSGAATSFGRTHFSMVQQCPALTACTITGMFWLDLDAAEIANNGMFLEKPLDITLSGEVCNSGGGVITQATMVGQLIEK
jgi:hypothetical protein